MRPTATVLLAFLLTGSAAGAPTPVAEAERWVAMVDAGNYADSWSSAGTLFQERVTNNAWASAVGAARKPLGAVLSRTKSKDEHVTSLQGMPDGEYEIIQFSTVFARRKVAIETVVLAHEPAGWRVDGYFVD